MLETIKKRLKNFPLERLQPSPQERGSTAAVLVALHGDSSDPQVILTQRAFHLNNHAGEVAFPGGMWDETDTDLLQTALREAHEEIGLFGRADCNTSSGCAETSQFKSHTFCWSG
jgi:8-oxo-dGTP pyrophosphatase MutT (NUDIX family)